MNTTKVAITIPKNILNLIDKFAQDNHVSRSEFISKSLDINIKALVEDEVARSYDEVFSSEEVLSEQKNWSDKLISANSSILSLWK